MALADEQIGKVTAIVNSKLSTIQDWVTRTKLAANNSIDAVGTLAVPNIEIQFPSAPAIGNPVPPDAGSVPDHTVTNDPESVAFSGVQNISFSAPSAIPAPVYGTPVSVPARPTPTLTAPPTVYPTTTNPVAPAVPVLTAPTAPTISLPDAPTLVGIDIPTLDMPDIQSFSVALPEYSNDLIKLNDQAGNVDTILDGLKSSFEGAVTDFTNRQRTNINAHYLTGADKQHALTNGDYDANRLAQRKRLMDEAAVAIDREVMGEVDKATTVWAARNFSIVPGMLIDQVNDLEIEGGRKLRAMSSKINQEIFKQAKEDFDKILAIYVAVEQNLIDYHLERIRRAVEQEKVKVRSQMELFNAALELYKAKQQTINAHIEAFNVEQKAKIQLVGAYKTAVEGAVAKTAENEARVRIYGTQVEALKVQTNVFTTSVKAATAPVEAFKAQLIGVKANADTAVANIESYREAIKGYAAAVDAASSEIRAYAAQVQAASSSAGVAETNARAYATYIQESVRNNSVYRTFASEQSEVLNAYLQTFREAANTNESFVRAQAAKVSAQVQVTTARAAAFDNHVRTYASYNRALAEKTAAVMSHSMTSAENAARAQALANQAQSEVSKISAGALAAKAQALAGLAQGAMSALHVSASAQGTGSTASSYGYGTNTVINWGGTTEKSESKTARVAT